uniref:Mitochondrial fission regulator 2 n=1 Tax=Angiostrongylus cantonensis TaxID=6313 RepID=A0A0K0CUC3_ANGCA
MDSSDADYDSVAQKNLARTTASSIEILMLYLETEVRRIIQSLEAQLEFLSKQMQALLAGKIPPVAPMACDFDASASDDEGKGASLGSPTEILKPTFISEEKKLSSLPNICPPADAPPPPPPPPPPLSLLSINSASMPKLEQSKAKPDPLQMLKRSSNLERDDLPVRPSADDLRMVQLKKTNTARSPGGTPIARHTRQSKEEGSYLANALREKFRSVQEYVSECEEDMSTSWLEDEL